MMRGFSPVSSSKDEALVLGGPLERLRMSITACVTAKSQNAIGELLATSAERVRSMMERVKTGTPVVGRATGGSLATDTAMLVRLCSSVACVRWFVAMNLKKQNMESNI